MQSLSSDELTNQIEATLKQLRPAFDEFSAAELERDKQNLIEDFGVADNPALTALIESYQPPAR